MSFLSTCSAPGRPPDSAALVRLLVSALRLLSQTIASAAPCKLPRYHLGPHNLRRSALPSAVSRVLFVEVDIAVPIFD